MELLFIKVNQESTIMILKSRFSKNYSNFTVENKYLNFLLCAHTSINTYCFLIIYLILTITSFTVS